MLHSNYLKQLDLQDIVVFLNLLELRSAKRTAELMNVSQPTVSYCLKRLRASFDDSLFGSSQGLLQPTAKAEKIAPYLRSVIDSVNRCAEDGVPDSANVMHKVWKLCAPDYFELAFLPQALAQLSRSHVNTSLHLDRLSRDLPVDRLMNGDLDMAIGFGPGYHQMHPELQWQPVVSDSFVCLVSQPPALEGPMTLDHYCAMAHVYPTPWVSDRNMVDGWLESLGRSRNILVRANGYQACINIVAAVPSCVALPTRLLPHLRIPDGVEVHAPPLGFPTFTLDMIWARERGATADLTSLRNLIQGVAGSLMRAG